MHFEACISLTGKEMPIRMPQYSPEFFLDDGDDGHPIASAGVGRSRPAGDTYVGRVKAKRFASALA